MICGFFLFSALFQFLDVVARGRIGGRDENIAGIVRGMD